MKIFTVEWLDNNKKKFRNNIHTLIKFILVLFGNVSTVLRSTQFAAHNYGSLRARDILHETSDEAGSLEATFAKYVERHKDAAQVPTIIRYADYFLLQKTSADQVAALVIFTSTYRQNAEPQIYVIVLNDIDSIIRKLGMIYDENFSESEVKFQKRPEIVN
uniref:Uncharacterized protein n=1 Tax=Glossina brevipalpis TaxID=37001 RepID=A0A1A9WZR7_9MUSC